MTSFLGFGSGNSSSAAAPAAPVDPKTEALKTRVKNSIVQEMTTAYATGLVNALSENCFEKCIFQPTDELSAQESKCISDCSTKFMRSWNLISKEYIARINKQA